MKQKPRLPILNICHYLMISVLLNPLLVAQVDDPLSDPIPKEYYNFVLNNQPVGGEAVITDVNGYDNFNLGVASAEPHLVQNPQNPIQYFASFNINTAYRTNDAFNWLTSAPNFGVSVNGDPVNAYDSLGNLFYETMFGGITGCKVIKSTDNGTIWTPSVTAISGRDKNWIAADQTSGPFANYLYTTMTGPSTGSVGNFARSTNSGVSFTQTATFNTQVLPGMMVAVGPDTNGSIDVPGGCVYVVTHSGSNSTGRYNFYRSTNGGASFDSMSSHLFSNYIGTEISGRSTVNGMRTRPYPFIAADNSYGPYRGRLYLVHASNNPAGNGNKPDIFLRFSTNQGATWSTPRVVNDDPNSQNNNNFFPAIWCDKTTGRLFIKWYDSRRVPTSDSIDVYATYTDDGGNTFAPNQRITNQTAKTKISSSGSAPAYQGDYDAITSLNNQALLVWTDFRANNYGSYVGFFPDYAMSISPGADTLMNYQDSLIVTLSIPEVKLYTDIVTFSSAYNPAPATGTINISFPSGNTISTFPNSILMKVITQDSVTPGIYTITVTGTGPNGTPVHKRNFTLTVNSIKTLTLNALIEGFYNGTAMVSDTITLDLRQTTSPYTILESTPVVVNTSGTAVGSFSNVTDGTPFYIALKHRNSLETWSATSKSFAAGSLFYDFTDDSSKAFGFNMKKNGTKWCIINGDCNLDGFIDGSDYVNIVNNWENTGSAMNGDTNGDQFIDGSDYVQIANSWERGSITPLIPKKTN